MFYFLKFKIFLPLGPAILSVEAHIPEIKAIERLTCTRTQTYSVALFVLLLQGKEKCLRETEAEKTERD